MSLTHNVTGNLNFNGVLDDKSSDMSPGATVIGTAKFVKNSPQRKFKPKHDNAPNNSLFDVKKLHL